MRHIKRRDFLKMLGAATAGAALSELDTLWAVPDELVEEALRGPGIETFTNTVCQLCPAGCGITVRLIDGVPVHIDGNPMHPINHGGICPHGAAGLDFLYHPDRIRQPLVRAGERGSGQWAPVSWDEALARVAQRLVELRQAGLPERAGFLVSERRGLTYEMASRFMEAIGSRNVIALNAEQSDFVPFDLLFGWKDIPEYDIENTQYLLSFGADFLEDGVSPLHAIRGFSKMRDSAGGGRGRFTYVDSRHSLTAASADTFLPIRPGTHGAFALGVAYVVIKERYLDSSFVRNHVVGFEPWVDGNGVQHSGFKSHVLENYYPERVAQITGVPARKIVDVGRDFGRTRPALAMIGPHGSSGTNGLFNALSVLALNVLVGSVERKGGLRVQRATPYKPLPPIEPDAIAQAGLEKPALFGERSDRYPLYGDTALGLCEALEADDSYPIDTLFIYGTNPAFDHPYARRIRRALAKVPFIVSFTTVLDESSEYADVILPESAYLERWMDSGPTPGVRFAHASIAQPVVQPFYDTRNAGDALIDISRAVGGSVAQTFPDATFFAALQERIQGVFASGAGAVISGSFEESWIKFLKERGWQNLVYESFEDFWKILVERGGWWDPVSDELPLEQVLQTRDGKISLVVTQLLDALTPNGMNEAQEDAGLREERLADWGISATGDAALIPHFEEARFNGDTKEYPYVLVVFGVLSNRRGSGSFSPLLQEMFGYYYRVYSSSWVEINPHTAHEHHIKQGDPVRVSSEYGSINARAVFNEVLEPQTIAMPFGLGHTAGGRYARGVGVNPYEILAEVSDNLWGKPAKMATRVKIDKSGEVG